MRFTVTWTPSAQEDMARLWLDAADRRHIAEAVNRIDELLAIDPHRVAEEFYGDYLFVVPPIHVVYSVSAADRLVET